ncbi:outer membrane protein TolC precursor [Pseudomonas antarctica]|uniref:Outer membrane protein TolC n=1 Tax=Pseudomonas antarctica TaxID=219572 RepID=A0ABQ6ZSS6_9PSED|nr:outer membrane protein TolC precursor [Pseudomonas antarctica]
MRELGALIGVQSVNIQDLAPLNQSFSAFTLTPANYDTWHELAISNNPTLASQRQAVEVARYEVERNRAGHLPKITAYASARQQESDSGNTYNQRYDTNTIGIEVSMPLYAGGGISASTRQASRGMEQAEYELEGKTRETLIELRRQFSACLSGVSKLRAYQKALTSAEALVVSTKQSILGGERVNLDALNAEQQLYTTRRDLAQARYDYLMAWTKLHYYAGNLRDTDLAKVDEAFGPVK